MLQQTDVHSQSVSATALVVVPTSKVSVITTSPPASSTAGCPVPCTAAYTTSTAWRGVACPQLCVTPGSPLCPTNSCGALPTKCSAGSTLTTPPLTAPTTILGNTTNGCSVTVTAQRGCALCGCFGCPKCALA